METCNCNCKSQLEAVNCEISLLKAEIASLKQAAAESHGKGNFRDQLASRVTAIVGLQEALSCERPWFRQIWSVLLLIGITATVVHIGLTTSEYLDYPVATIVELKAYSKYDYDPLILCPDSWLDAEKAVRNGLSLEGLKYSLGYFNDFDNIYVEHGSKAREEFLKFYSDQNFTSFRNYLDFITIDLIKRDRPTATSRLNSSIPSYACTGCDASEPKKMYVSGGNCYVIKLLPAEGGTTAANTVLVMNLYNRTLGIIQVTDVWNLAFCQSNHTYFTPGCPRTRIKSSFRSHVKLNVHRYATLSTRKSHCSDIADRTYSQAQCIAMCQSEIFQETVHCRQFSDYRGFLPPSSFCNHFDDTLSNRSVSLLEFYSSEEGQELTARSTVECTKRCPRPCVRYVNEVSLQSEFDIRLYGKMNSIYDASRPKAAVIYLEVQHSASYEGGILTWTEVQSYTLTQLISNFGGALGLFVGGTIMTLAQLVMFIIDYAIGKKKEERREK